MRHRRGIPLLATDVVLLYVLHDNKIHPRRRDNVSCTIKVLYSIDFVR